MIIDLTSNIGRFEKPLVLTESSGMVEKPWVTVIVGENGTQKSLLLRSIVRNLSGVAANRLNIAGTVSQVIALSGTPLDRFPRPMSGSRKPDAVRYTYFGQRAANGVAGTGQSERGLAGVLIANRGRLKETKDELERVFGQLGLKPWLRVAFKVASRFSYKQSMDREHIITRIQHYLELPLAAQAPAQDRRDYKFAANFLATAESERKLFDVLDQLQTNLCSITLSPAKNSVSKDTFPVSVWRALLEAGVIDVDSTQFQTTGKQWSDRVIPGDHLSSGQWSWLCTLSGLAVQATDDSVILVDEPENSLHPAWQRDYIPTLLAILERTKRCHVLVATHAPLIASGLPPDSGNVRRLRREVKENGNAVVSSTEAVNTFGWSASDAYEALFQLETTRAKLFNKEAMSALEMVKNRSETMDKRLATAKALREHCAALLPLDPMRQVLENIAWSLEMKRER